MSGLRLYHKYNPSPDTVPCSVYEFLRSLSGPTVIHIDGEQADNTRVVTTLLHGNEPSGLRAIHQLLKTGIRPLTNVKFIIASVVAARTEPVFTHRMLPGQRDLNRCFTPPYKDLQGELARAIEAFILCCTPEAVIDLHNTSGSGPAFSVSALNHQNNLALASHFSHWYIQTDIRLGAIMERQLGCPVVTIEAGGAQDQEADINALVGLKSFLHSDDLFSMHQEMVILNKPRRLEIKPSASLIYGEQFDCNFNITMCQNVESHNFGVTRPDQLLGWVDHNGLANFHLGEPKQDKMPADFFTVEQGKLRVKRPLKLFMVTSRVDIAKSDCLLYFVEAPPY